VPETYGQNLFATTLRYPSRRFPLSEKSRTVEVSAPWRIGMGRSFRVPFTRRALVIGRWGAAGEEEERLTEALGLAEFSAATEEIAEWD
jgi:hypothetical protein